jgi:hypothetical protein
MATDEAASRDANNDTLSNRLKTTATDVAESQSRWFLRQSCHVVRRALSVPLPGQRR